MASSLPYLGENCEQVGITAQGIVTRELPVLPISSITKGVVLELNTFRFNCNFSWNYFYEWLKLILDDVLPVTPASIKAAVLRLSKKSSKLSRNKHGGQIILLLQEPFFAGQSRPVTEQPQPKDNGVEVQHKPTARLDQ